MTAVSEVTVRDVRGQAEMSACCALYRSVMALGPGDGSINPRLLTGIQHNGGHVVGAFLGPRLVGFAYSFLGRDPARPTALYQYSALAVVAEGMQDRGIGRRLKLAQRERCLADGIERMRWAFDPFKTRNAHVNLDVLGGEVIAFNPAMYGARGFGADREDESDRFVVEWPLARTGPAPTWPAPAPAPPPATAPAPASREWREGDVVADGDHVLIAVPAQWDRRRAELGGTAAAALRRDVRASFAEALAAGRVGVSCVRVGPDLAVYRFVPRDPSRQQGG
jgi:predicted GNAT superfamily acetyltransferase